MYYELQIVPAHDNNQTILNLNQSFFIRPSIDLMIIWTLQFPGFWMF